jgi:hypothetical protein
LYMAGSELVASWAIVSRMHGSKSLKLLYRIATSIFYIPASRPHPASEKRRKAYETGALLPCPMYDPEGWLAWPTLTIYGVINPDTSARHTKTECTVRDLQIR